MPELINDLRNILSTTPESIVMFNSALLSIGFIEDKTNHYKRRFLLEEKRIMRVSGDFPRIVSSKINNEIRKVKYELDLDMIVGFEIDFIEVLNQLKAI